MARATTSPTRPPLSRLEQNGQVVFRYCRPDGLVLPEANPNGSVHNIAGIVNRAGNVLGMMPHPERCAEPELGGTDGLRLFKSVMNSFRRPQCRPPQGGRQGTFSRPQAAATAEGEIPSAGRQGRRALRRAFHPCCRVPGAPRQRFRRRGIVTSAELVPPWLGRHSRRPGGRAGDWGRAVALSAGSAAVPGSSRAVVGAGTLASPRNPGAARRGARQSAFPLAAASSAGGAPAATAIPEGTSTPPWGGGSPFSGGCPGDRRRRLRVAPAPPPSASSGGRVGSLPPPPRPALAGEPA